MKRSSDLFKVTLAFAILLLASAASLQPVFALPTSAEIEASLRESSEIKKDKQLTLSVNENELQISTYTDPQSKDIARDCKIDAILLARTAMSKYPEIVRVVVNFYATKSDKYWQSTITKPEILAFGSGQVDSAEMIKAIRLEERISTVKENASESTTSAPPVGAPAALGSVSAASVPPKEKEAGNSNNSSASPKGLTAMQQAKNNWSNMIKSGANPEAKWVTYRGQGLAFQYPEVWVVRGQMEVDKNTVVNLTNPTETATIGLKLFASPDKLTVMEEAEKRLRFHHKLTNFKQTNPTEVITFGANNSIKGVAHTFTYVSKEGRPRKDKRVLFGWTGYVFMIFVSATERDYPHALDIFKHTISTLRIDSGPSGTK